MAHHPGIFEERVLAFEDVVVSPAYADPARPHQHVPDGRFWLVLSYRKENTVDELVHDAARDAEQLDAFKVTGGAAMLFDGIDGPSTRPSASAD